MPRAFFSRKESVGCGDQREPHRSSERPLIISQSGGRTIDWLAACTVLFSRAMRFTSITASYPMSRGNRHLDDGALVC
jgi:hypothetical protein